MAACGIHEKSVGLIHDRDQWNGEANDCGNLFGFVVRAHIP